MGSVEGRVAVEWVDGRPLDNNNTTMPKDYAFKCHRRNDLVFPVNCIEFHPVYGTFATGGGDGTVGTCKRTQRGRKNNGMPDGHVVYFHCNFVPHTETHLTGILFLFATTTTTCYLTVTWDGFNRKRLTALPAFGTSVAALAFSPDGTTLAMASSYTFEEGERDHPRDEIYVRRMLDSDCQPKKKT
jgi:cell cycle arrest protein BUB3